MHTLKRLLLCLLIGILLISSTTSLAGVEVTDPDTAAYQQPGSQVRSNGTVRIRANASTASAEVGQIGWGEVATLLAVDGRWYQIDFNGVIGWVAAEWFVLVSGDVPAAPPENNPPPSSDPAPAQPVTVDASSASGIVESRGTVRLRANPSTGSASLAQIGWGERAVLLATQGNWYQINYNGTVGWVAAEWFVLVSGDAASVPQTTAPVESAPVPEQAPAEVVESTPLTGTVIESRGNVNIRSSASLSASRLGVIGWGERAHVLSAQGTWYQISYNGIVGWVMSEYFVLVSGDINTTVDSSAPSASGGAGTVVQAQGTVALRSRPTTVSQRLAQIGWGQQVTVIGANANGLWYQVDYNGKVGWVMSEWFSPASAPIPQAEASAPAPAPIPVVSEAPTVEETVVEVAVSVPSTPSVDGSFVQALDNLRIRSDASINGSIVGQIGWGQVANLVGVDGTGLWYQVSYNGVTGWARSEWFLRTGSLPAFVPVPEVPDPPAPTAGTFLSIPKIGVDSPIVYFPIVIDPTEGAIWYISPQERYVGHLEGTARPGDFGNVVMGAHSEYPNGSPGLFSRLGSLAVGDQIRMNASGRIKNYTVTRVYTVPFTDVSVVQPTGKDQITLITCTSYSAAQGLYLERIIVVAEAIN